MEVADALDQTFAHAHTVIAGVAPAQYGDTTPCTEWTVRDLLEHMIGVVAGLGAAAAGDTPPPFELGPDPAAQFADAATAALDAWRRPGVLDRVIDGGAGAMPGHVYASINLLDTATHTWDLATATGQPAELPEPVASAAMEASRMTVTDQIRTGRFAAEQQAPSGASATQQLVTFLGRSA
jgi:uncharacterized protein (TIGR03086 family)